MSLTVERLSGSFMPDELVKFCHTHSILIAFRSSFSGNFGACYASAKATQASLPEAIIIPLSKSSTDAV